MEFTCLLAIVFRLILKLGGSPNLFLSCDFFKLGGMPPNLFLSCDFFLLSSLFFLTICFFSYMLNSISTKLSQNDQ